MTRRSKKQRTFLSYLNATLQGIFICQFSLEGIVTCGCSGHSPDTPFWTKSKLSRGMSCCTLNTWFISGLSIDQCARCCENPSHSPWEPLPRPSSTDGVMPGSACQQQVMTWTCTTTNNRPQTRSTITTDRVHVPENQMLFPMVR